MRFQTFVAALSLVVSAAPDAGDDAYQFLFGLHQKGLHEMVVQEAEGFLRDFPRHEKRSLARYRLASALFDLGRPADAAPHFRELARLPEFDFAVEVQFRLGQCELAQDRPAEAAVELERVVASGADYLLLPATFLLGEAHFRAGDYERAEGCYARVASAEEHAREAAYGLAWCAFRLERSDEATQRIRAYLERFPDGDSSGEMRHLLGEAELRAGRAERALEAFASVPPGAFREAALHGIGFANAGLGRHLDAARSFATLIDEHPESRFASEAVLHLGIHLLQVGEAEKARAAFELPQAARDAEHHYWLARALIETGELEAALAALNRVSDDESVRASDRSGRHSPIASGAESARGTDPNDLLERIRAARGDVLFRLGRAQEAARAWGESGSDYALHAAAVASFNDGRHADAVRLARTLLEKDGSGPYAARTRLALGEALFALGELTQAKEAFLAVASAEEPELHVRALLRAGWCDFLSGDLVSAAALLARIADEHPSSPDGHEAFYVRGRVLESLGDVEAARRSFESCLERDRVGPHAPAALLGLARLEPGASGSNRLEELLSRHPESAEAPLALYALAERQAQAGAHARASERFAEFVRRFAEHELAPAALYGRAWSLYSQGDPESALAALDALDALDARVGAEGALAGNSDSRTDRSGATADPELVLSALELRIFAADATDRADVAANAWNRFARLCGDEMRRLGCARIAAAALERAGERARARALLAELVGGLRDPATLAAARVEGAWLALAGENLDEAGAELERALAIDGGNVSALEAAFFVGEAYFARSEDANATTWYAIASKAASPVADRALYKQGFASMRGGDHAAAARAFAALTERHPASELYGEALFLQGEMLFRQGDHERAAQCFQRLLGELPKHEVLPKALFRGGICLAHLERFAEAESALSDLARRFPEFENGVEAELWRGRALAAQAKDRSARQVFARVIASDGGVLAARARLGLGRLSLAAGDVEAALSEFLKVALLYAHDEEVAEALLLAGECLEAKGDVPKAHEQYREIVKEYPDSSSAAEAQRRLGANDQQEFSR